MDDLLSELWRNKNELVILMFYSSAYPQPTFPSQVSQSAGTTTLNQASTTATALSPPPRLSTPK